ncbi:MAG: SAGA HAT/Core module component [Watsoniomyces obsoletus]|nr:MAG: SAGA HAT/Core module component [Watsoniomyces obsoletus]
MASRSRPRGGAAKEDDAHEERNLWTQISTALRNLKNTHVRAAEISKSIVETEEKLTVLTVADIDVLQELYREAFKLAEDEQQILNDDPSGVIQRISLLSALRSASENEPPRAIPNVKSRNLKRKFEADGRADSPGPSPAGAAPAGHARVKASSGRSGSVPFTPRDAKESSSSKTDETPSTSNGPTDGRGAAAEKAGLLVKNAEVAYKQGRQKGAEGDWIQCIIINVSGEGKNKRYDVQDPEPDEQGAPGQIYRASAASLVPIPPVGAALPDYPKGKQVLARYPDTTTFYRAEVMGMKRDSCRLKFEGEEEIGKEMDVDRRYVLDDGGKMKGGNQ